MLPAIESQAVGVHHWLTGSQFAQVFALSQAEPGPSSMFSSMIGLEAAGLPGAVVAILALMTPSCLLMYLGSRTWERFRDAQWRIAFQRGMAPITLGPLFSSGVTVVRASDHGVVGYVITAVTAILLVRTGINPLIIMIVAGGLGALGLVSTG